MVYAGKARLVSTENENWIRTACNKTLSGRGCKTLLRLHCKKCDICNSSTKIDAVNNVIPKKKMTINADNISQKFYDDFIETAFVESIKNKILG